MLTQQWLWSCPVALTSTIHHIPRIMLCFCYPTHLTTALPCFDFQWLVFVKSCPLLSRKQDLCHLLASLPSSDDVFFELVWLINLCVFSSYSLKCCCCFCKYFPDLWVLTSPWWSGHWWLSVRPSCSWQTVVKQTVVCRHVGRQADE